jgi:molybdopterin-guanine dinucleotide biosynthesis protein A
MTPFVGVVLAGGQSQRMGRDKALVEVDGQPMAARVAGALREAGAAPILSVGGDADALAQLGFDVVADEHPGEGPLGGLLTGLRAAEGSIAFVAACDLPWLDATTVEATLDALSAADTDVAAPLADGRTLYLCAAYRPSALALLESAFAGGERAVHRAAATLRRVSVEPIDRRAVSDVDTPQDLGSTDRPR